MDFEKIYCPHCEARSTARLAAGDVYCGCCACLLTRLNRAQPIPFGKYAGQTVAQMLGPVKLGYLRWALDKVDRLDLPLRAAMLHQLGLLRTH